MDREPTIRSRELGEGLRKAMDKSGLNGKEVAHLLDWSPSWVSRLLSGRRGSTEADVAAFLGVCRVRGKERTRLLELVHEQDRPGWLQQHGSRLPQQLVTLVDHETKAITISDFQPLVVPGMLQTGQYARALMQGTGNIPAEEIEDRVAARMARRSLLSRSRPPQITYFIHEFVLRLPVGGAEVMSEQLHALLRISVRPFLTLRVVPAALGAHAGTAGPFKLMEFTELKPVAYLDSETSCLFLEKPEEITAYRGILRRLAETTPSEGESRELIATIATELYADREDHDDGA